MLACLLAWILMIVLYAEKADFIVSFVCQLIFIATFSHLYFFTILRLIVVLLITVVFCRLHSLIVVVLFCIVYNMVNGRCRCFVVVTQQ